MRRPILATGLLLLVATVATLAIDQDGNIDLADICEINATSGDSSRWKTYFVALPSLPSECRSGQCLIAEEPCAIRWSYVYRSGIMRFEAPRVVAGALKLHAEQNGGSWIGTWGDVQALQDQTAVKAMHECWLLPQADPHPVTGAQVPRVCRFGHLYGVGQGGTSPCSPAGKPIPCESAQGSDYAELVADEVFQ